jgi:hypothetical protein
MGMTFYGGMDEQSTQRQLKEYVDRNEQIMMDLNDREKALRAQQETVVAGMGSLAQERKPSAEFMAYLDEMESAAASKVRESADKTLGYSSDERFVSSREDLKSYTDLRGFIESL